MKKSVISKSAHLKSNNNESKVAQLQQQRQKNKKRKPTRKLAKKTLQLENNA